ncbi:MAG: hypothetical protein PQJ60_11135, partial [Spirochaetales bacterium]|nr:hypothetical protein [Spirochaetales bacterium]
MKFKNLPISIKLIIQFILIGLIPLSLFGLLSNRTLKRELLEAQYNQLNSIREIKKKQIESYFAERRGDMQVLSDLISTHVEGAKIRIGSIRELKKREVENLLRVSNPDQRSTQNQLNLIVNDFHGLQETGETYLVYEKESKIYFGSDVLRSGKGTYVQGTDLTSTAPDYIRSALRGTAKTEILTDDSGELVLVSYSPLGYDGGNWAIITKIDL